MIKVIETSNAKEFESDVNDYINFGYKIIASSCGFINSEQYDFAGCYQAILEKSNPHLTGTEVNPDGK